MAGLKARLDSDVRGRLYNGCSMPADELAALLLVQVAVILTVCRAVGSVIRRVRQPQVIAEMIAGFMLGPSLLGVVAPSVEAFLFPAAAMPVLYVASQLGLVLYIFCVGLEFRLDLLRQLGRTAAAVAVAGIAGPLALGAALAIVLVARPGIFPPGVTTFDAVLFMGAAMAITAFPVLARIISERGISGTTVGALALAAGAIGDAVAWILLAFVLASFSGDTMVVLAALGGTAAYVVLVAGGARPLAARLAARVDREGAIGPPVLAAMLVMLALGAWFTDRAGVHSVFGAFLLGVAVPRGRLADGLRRIIEPLTTALLVPLFFVYSGLNTEIGLLNSGALWAIALAILLTACAGKGLPCWAAARLSGATPRDAWAVATLMNARGMVELILLNIGLERGLITPTLFTMMVLMALATTVMTGPLFSRVWRDTR
jgi:Kef-type K+ transport system membrane component KefB